MMKNLLVLYLQSGLFGSIIILLILVLRQLLRKAPRKYLCVLWLLAAMRLLLPINLESHLSLQPRYDSFKIAGTLTEQIETPQVLPQWTPVEPNVEVQNPAEPGPDIDVQNPANPIPDMEINYPPEPVQNTSDPLDYIQVMSVVWMCVGGILLLYTLISYGYLRFKVRDAVKYSSGIMESDRIQGAFLLGYLVPKIYLPVGLCERDREFIIAHERAHISRGDNWWKLVGFVCVCIHWYNPLVWVGYGFLCRDIEIACDERVVRNMDLEQRKAYSFALLNCGKRLSGFMACPVAFGEVGLKQRIKNVLSYRRPRLWITVISVALVIFVAACFLTTPATSAAVLPTETEPITTDYFDAVPTEEPTTVPTDATVPIPTDPEETIIPTSTTEPITEPTTQPTDAPTTAPTAPPSPKPTEPPTTAPEEIPDDGVAVIAEGKWDFGPVTWKVTSDGTLRISGNKHIQEANDYIWKEYADIITQIVVEDGITCVPQYAFSDMPNVTGVYLSKNLNYIGEYAFANCACLRSISIPAQVLEIKEYAFYGCSSMTTVKFAEGCQIQTIEEYAFAKTGLTSFIRPKSMVEMSVRVLAYCTSLQYYEDSNVKLWGPSLCSGKTPFNSDGIEKAELYEDYFISFEDGTILKSVLIAGSVTRIEHDKFSGCVSLSSVTITAPITSIENYAFENCVSLTSLKIPNTVTSIGIGAFSGSGITELTIPASVTEMGWNVFGGSAIQKVIFLGDAPVFQNDTFSNIKVSVYYPADNPTWTEEIMQKFSENVTWIPQ